ncbi:MAG: class I SAM-dependent methyltransferase [Candidatus Pacebacteria bacterium]|nr:class I SAM-dependent methyltransferase [Candidatus Paceibacterota bacterium]
MQNSQKEYFDQAYRTGSDIWSHIPYQSVLLSVLPQLEKDAFILDVGSGRGLWAQRLLALGYRVLGIDYIPAIVQQVNKDFKLEGIEHRARFVVGDVLDIPFADASFDMATDIGTLQHLDPAEWQTYVTEIARVTKSGGWYVNVSLSRETTRFMTWNPKHSEQQKFEKFGVSYYFFDAGEIVQLFQKDFIKKQQIVRYFDAKSDPHDNVALVMTVFQKKN